MKREKRRTGETKEGDRCVDRKEERGREGMGEMRNRERKVGRK